MDRITGTVKFFNFSKGFGFVQPADGSKDVFLHVSALERAGINGLNEGDKISFVVEDDRRGRGKQAAQVEAGLTSPRRCPSEKAAGPAGGIFIWGTS